MALSFTQTITPDAFRILIMLSILTSRSSSLYGLMTTDN
jgi:hypothetical protein